MTFSKLFSTESVSPGHPDKIADAISDLSVDFFLGKDKHGRCAVETLVTTNRVILAGEVSIRSAYKEQDLFARIKEYLIQNKLEQSGFNADKIQFMNFIHSQSLDISNAVDKAGQWSDLGAGDQGMMFGYACDDNPSYMPNSYLHSRQIIQDLYKEYCSGNMPYLLPDSKVQLTAVLNNDMQLMKYAEINISHQHKENISIEDLKQAFLPRIKEIIDSKYITKDTKFIVNNSGRFVVGGPDGDSGLTGRKIIVDTYGGYVPHGGGAFSGKDYTKVDRTIAYFARYIAKNIVASGMAKKCLVQLSYVIGSAYPAGFYINTYNTATIDESKIVEQISPIVNMPLSDIIDMLKLRATHFLPTAQWGHFGYTDNDPVRTWEHLNLLEKI